MKLKSMLTHGRSSKISKNHDHRFTDERDHFKYRIDAENAARQKGELIKNYFHRTKSSLDRGWPESIEVTVHADEAAQTVE